MVTLLLLLIVVNISTWREPDSWTFSPAQGKGINTTLEKSIEMFVVVVGAAGADIGKLSMPVISENKKYILYFFIEVLLLFDTVVTNRLSY